MTGREPRSHLQGQVTYTPLPASDLAAVVTYLEMRAPPATPVLSSPLSLQRIDDPNAEEYRRLFRRVGAPWLWFSRLVMEDAQLLAIIGHRLVELFAVIDQAGHEVGMLELDFREAGQCELAFVGLVPELSGLGHGRWLLAEAVSRAWGGDAIKRVHVHTCSLDHPAALRAYERAGFRATSRAIEYFPDPRLLGVLPRDCAPQVPLLGTDG